MCQATSVNSTFSQDFRAPTKRAKSRLLQPHSGTNPTIIKTKKSNQKYKYKIEHVEEIDIWARESLGGVGSFHLSLVRS